MYVALREHDDRGSKAPRVDLRDEGGRVDHGPALSY